MKTLRQEAGIELEDLSLDFLEEVLRVWSLHGLDAARCFAMGC